MSSGSLFVLSLASLVLGASHNFEKATLRVVESVRVPPVSFTSLGPAPAEHVLDLRIALASSDIAGLDAALQEVSTPGREKYGQWLSRDDVAAYVRPTTETFSLATHWLASNGLNATNASYAGEWLQVAVPVSKASAMLGADFRVYKDGATGRTAVRTLSYAIPAVLHGHISLVHPTVDFAFHGSLQTTKPVPTTPPPAAQSDAATCESVTTPACIQELYGIPSTPVKNPDKLSFFIGQYTAEYMDFLDLNTWLGRYRPDLKSSNATFDVVSVANGTNSQDDEFAGTEACLDFELGMGLATGVPTTMLSTGPPNPNVVNNSQFMTSVLDSALFLAGMNDMPNVISTSYGVAENSISPALAIAVCNAYMQAGARGTSVIYSSGDQGVSGNTVAACTNTSFIPVFPATCPYVTSVGGTQLLTGSSTLTEVAVNYTEQFWASSGGFSNVFARPSYQESAVASYVSSIDGLYPGRWNTTGRGFPDVSAIAVGFPVLCFLVNLSIGGTSGAAPVFASIVALMNDVRVSAGKPALGFLNPLLYSIGDTTFTDILQGNNPGCGTTGFPAAVGWDAVTGLGTPIFAKIEKEILSL